MQNKSLIRRKPSHGNLVAPPRACRLWISGRTGQVIHGNLVAGPTVSWSRPSRKPAGPATVTWSHKPI